MKDKLVIITAVLLAACTQQNTPQDTNYADSLVYADENTSIYLCDHEWTGILLSTSDPLTLISNTQWTVPTKDEAAALHTVSLSTTHTQRYLAYDKATATYYTFLFNNEGSISKAGTKTKYTLRPVRVVTTPKDTIIQL